MIVPTWAYWLAIGALTVAVAGQQARVANAKRETAELQSTFDRERAARAEEVAKHREEKAAIQAAHAAQQQETVDEFQKKLRALQGLVGERTALVGRLREQLASYTAVDRAPGESDASVCQRTDNRLKALGPVLAEGAELVAEGAAIVQRRDAEVALLVGQVKTDRVACSAGASSAPETNP